MASSPCTNVPAAAISFICAVSHKSVLDAHLARLLLEQGVLRWMREQLDEHKKMLASDEELWEQSDSPER